jgi:hypothetical protein
MSYCDIWFAPNAEADKWANKIKLVKEDTNFYAVKNIPCWDYIIRSDADEADGVTKILTTYNTTTDPRSGVETKCWYGVCRHHARIYTVMFQERKKGQYTIIDGKSLKAMYVESLHHGWLEVYIKDEGYFWYDVLYPYLMLRGQKEAIYMGNRWNCGDRRTGLSSYNPEWAGEPPPHEPPPYEPPAKSYINCNTTPNGARIWLKKK